MSMASVEAGTRTSSTQTAYDTIYIVALVHLVVFHFLLIDIPSFFGILDVFDTSAWTMLGIQILAFLFALVMWIVITTCMARYFVKKVIGEVQQRGAAMLNSTSVYFLVTSVVHAIYVVAWIIWLANYNGLAPLNFTHNLGPFVIKRDLFLGQFIVSLLALFYFLHDMRYQTLTLNVRASMRAKATPSSETTDR